MDAVMLSVASTIYRGQARVITEATERLKPSELAKVIGADLQRLAETVADVCSRLDADVRSHWKRLFASELTDPAGDGARLLEALEAVGRSVEAYEQAATQVVAIESFGLTFDVGQLRRWREKLEAHAKKIREEWPIPDVAEIEAARERMDNQGKFVTLEEFARGVDTANR